MDETSADTRGREPIDSLLPPPFLFYNDVILRGWCLQVTVAVRAGTSDVLPPNLESHNILKFCHTSSLEMKPWILPRLRTSNTIIVLLIIALAPPASTRAHVLTLPATWFLPDPSE